MWLNKLGKKVRKTPEVPSGSNIIFNDHRASRLYDDGVVLEGRLRKKSDWKMKE
nr:hypothetical protein [Candidatus Hamiltonella defensa]